MAPPLKKLVPPKMSQPPTPPRMEKFIEICFTEVLAELNAQGDRTIPAHEQYTLFRNAVKKHTTDDVPEELIIKMALHLMGILDEACDATGRNTGKELGFAINVATGEAVEVPADYVRQMGGKHVKDIPATGAPPVVYGVPPRMPETEEEDPMGMD